MARHEIVIHENTGATKGSAPYLGSYIADATATIPLDGETPPAFFNAKIEEQ